MSRKANNVKLTAVHWQSWTAARPIGLCGNEALHQWQARGPISVLFLPQNSWTKTRRKSKFTTHVSNATCNGLYNCKVERS